MKGREMKISDILKSRLKQNKVIDFSCNGKCSCCGECCSCFLPVTQNEINVMQKYVIEHKIRPQKQLLVMENKLSCPYYDGKRCLIYEIRPLICKEFYCYKEPDIETARKMTKEKRTTVNMWAVAQEIDKHFRREYETRNIRETNGKAKTKTK